MMKKTALKLKLTLTVTLATLALTVPLRAQDLDPIRNTSNIDLSQITGAFTRNLSALDKNLSARMHDEDTHQLLLTVIAKAQDISRYYRSGGGAGKRRQFLEQQEKQKRQAGYSLSDKEREERMSKAIQDTDPDNMFAKSRGDFGRSVGELQRYLGLYQTADTQVTDIIRLIQEHLQYYQTALGKYQ
jgi:hypothetical protein